MTIEEWLKTATATLNDVKISTARLDSLILLEDATGKDRAWLLAHPEYELNDQNIKDLDEKIKRRSLYEPLAYIRGKSEFYGREFRVTPATLQPRPETETMISLLINQANHSQIDSIIDIGTGSGCIAITAKLEMPEIQVSATEINEDALKIARENANSLGADIKFYQGNLLEPLKNQISDNKSSAILANLPYVPDRYTIDQAAMQEPKQAIFGGEDGLDLYRDLFEQIDSLEQKPKLILTESLPFQHTQLAATAKSSGYKLTETEDLIQVFISQN